MNEQPAFPDPWWDLRPDGSVESRQREFLHAELLTEVSVGHPLHGLRIEVIGRSEASDDIVVKLATGGWARVHLTYKRAPETPPWPNTTFYDTIHALERDLREPG
jgi:cation diffusion facilitator CzcD-associated flavoprotein CzcO